MPETVRPVDATADGCPVLIKLRAATTPKGTTPFLEWTIRDAEGNPIDLAEHLCTAEESEEDPDGCGQVIFRFTDAASPGVIQQLIGEGVTAEDGTVRVELTEDVTCNAGIQMFQVAITDNAGKIRHLNDGFLSVERGLFGNTEQLYGPPTLQELRMELRDSAPENSRLADFEFSDAELIACLVKPLQQWNERPPPLARRTSANFPYPYNWTKAAVGELLMIAAHNYRRNKTQMTAAGVTDQALDRDMAYEAKAQLLRQEWLAFVDHKKVELNALGGFTTMPSGWY